MLSAMGIGYLLRRSAEFFAIWASTGMTVKSLSINETRSSATSLPSFSMLSLYSSWMVTAETYFVPLAFRWDFVVDSLASSSE